MKKRYPCLKLKNNKKRNFCLNTKIKILFTLVPKKSYQLYFSNNVAWKKIKFFKMNSNSFEIKTLDL